MSIKLLPCPFCGEKYGLEMQSHHTNPNVSRVRCLECDASAFLQPNPIGSNATWNTRAKASDQPVGCREEFEAWFEREHQPITSAMRLEGGCYANDYESGCYIGYYWEAWQEAWKPKRESGERIHQEEILSGLIYHAILENPGIMEARDAVLTIIRPHLPKEGELPKRNETVALTSHAHAIIGFIESLEDIEGDIPEEWGVALRGYAKRLEAALSKIEGDK